LYRRELAVATDAQAMAAAAIRHICVAFHGTAVVLIADPRGRLSLMPPANLISAPDETAR
jgi:hypothetical protein